MIFFDWIYMQYKRERKVLFSSKFMNWHGNLFVGKPRLKDIPVLDDQTKKQLHDSYFYDPSDRIPVGESWNDKEWNRGMLFLTCFRESQERLLSFRMFWWGLIACTVLTVAGGVIEKATDGIESVAKPRQAKR